MVDCANLPDRLIISGFWRRNSKVAVLVTFVDGPVTSEISREFGVRIRQ